MPKLTLLNDTKLDIAIGKRRKDMNWKSGPILWSALIERLSTPHKTHETHAAYMRMTKEEQAPIKDIGGFVGGRLSGGRRKTEYVMYRTILTLDLDHKVPTDLWDSFTLLFEDTAAVLHSTHKHSPENPRYRLIIPLDRQVFSDEYMAIGRKVAERIGIDYFDDTTFQPERLMYWPSTSTDGIYEFEYADGTFLNADNILALYDDWKDSSDWPISSRVDAIVLRNIKKQGDPIDKPGIVGRFCRSYTISETIESFLSEVYEVCDVQDRFTFIAGTTSAGLVVYEEKYAYSHHGTDPTGGKLCNAFDLVRLHKFGLKDEDASAGTPINKLPSYLAMQEFSARDPKVKMQIGEEKLAEAREEFGEVDTDEPLLVIGEVDDTLDDNEWIKTLDADKKGNWLSTIDNIYKILTNDPALKGRLAYNDFDKREVALRTVPWRKVTAMTMNLIDTDDASLRHYLERAYGISSAPKITDALSIVLQKNKFHPVRDYLKSCKWDGEERLDSLFIDFLGAEDNEYVRAITRKCLVAAVARVMQPGIKFDTVLVPIGAQGLGKSTLIRALGVDWFSDSFTGVKGKEAIEQLQGVWIMELSELANISNYELEAVKTYVRRGTDRYRVAYGKRTEDFPRQGIFIGSGNIDSFLKDTTGNRAWWPIRIGVVKPTLNVFKDLNRDLIKQVWAEAVEQYNAGESLHLDTDTELLAKEVQASHMEVDDRTETVVKYLNTLLPKNWTKLDIYQRRAFIKNGPDELDIEGTILRKHVSAAEVWVEALDGQPKDMTPHNTKFIHNILRQLPDWKPSEGEKSRTLIYGTQRSYIRIKNPKMLPQ